MALGLGVDPFGQPRLGLDAVAPPARYLITKIAAKRVDHKTGVFEVNDDGQYVGSSALVQWVVLQLTVLRGSIPAALGVGNPALRYSHIGVDHIQNVTNDIRQALEPRVASGELQIDAVDVDAPDNATIMRVDFTDLTAPVPTRHSVKL